MPDRRINTRVILKHGKEADWNLSSLVPLEGETIIYLPDDQHPYMRQKIGDGETSVTALPFCDFFDIEQFATSEAVTNIQNDLNNIKSGGAGSYIPTLQMGQEKTGLNFIENGSWVPNPAGNYWSGWSHVEDIIELEDGSTETITTWQLKGMWITGNDYFQILISPQGIFERDLFMNTETWTREQSKWRKWATSTDLANKTSVTVGGVHQKEFNADTKLTKVTSTSSSTRLYGVGTNGQQKMMPVSASQLIDGAIVVRLSETNGGSGQILVPASPTADGHATSKKYVDNNTFSLNVGIEKTDLNFNWNSSTKKWDYNPIGNYYGENGGSIEVASFYNSNMGIVQSVYFNYWKLIGVKNSDDSCLQILFTEPAIFVRTIGLTSGSQTSWIMPGEEVIQSFVSTKCSEVVQYCDDYLANRYNENWWYADQWFTGNVNISENLTIDKDLIVKGTTYTQDAQTQLIAENILELNSDKIDNKTVLSGLAINKDSSSTYGIMYDPADDTVKLGEGTTDSGEFSFNEGEGNPIAIRDDSAEFTSGNFVTFDTDKNKLVDSKQSLNSIKSWVQDLLEMTVAVTTNDDLTKTYTVNAKDSLIGHKITVDGTEEIIIGGTPNGN